MKLKKLRYFVLASVLLTLTGCWDRQEINDVAFVMGTAIDKSDKQYRSTVQVALPGQLGGAGSKGGGGGTSGGKSYLMQSTEGKNIREINNQQQRSNPRELNFAHRRLILVGEEMARSGIEPIIDVLGRIPQNRLSALMIVTRGEAKKILETDVPMENFPSEAIRELALTAMKEPRSLKHVVNIMIADGVDLALPYAVADKNQKKLIKIEGLAVFKNNKLVGFLKSNQATGALLAMGEAQQPEIIVRPPAGVDEIVTQIQEYTVDVKPIVKRDKITMEMSIKGRGVVVENESNYDIDSETNIIALEQKLNKEIKDNILKSMDRLQHEYKADVVGFGQLIYNEKPAEWKKIENRWGEIYPEVEVAVKPDIHIENVGAVITPLGRKESHLIND
ncbi:Ger(x)C family spore germination protein [Bacillus sp. V33-4]|uniref:Ger(x)C family spore germination protein n=1 Tax=Bacillus sp. V33-4 TaxID=2054169 RepID=UPI000C771F15|nr:Ger(x)C family spore germination protein [Bacillus sp. V33-4]PLR83848.1 Ger(x)C family spore germination protein [Bacillus sp. V33-4]